MSTIHDRAALAQGRRYASPAEAFAARQRSRRYLAAHWPDGSGGINPMFRRFCSIKQVIKAEHGGVLQNDDKSRAFVHLLAHTIMAGCADPGGIIRKTVPVIAPWIDVEALIVEIEEFWNSHPKPYSKRKAGRIIGLTDAQRTRAQAWQLLPIDKTDKQLEARRQRRHRISQRKYRMQRKAEADAAKTEPPKKTSWRVRLADHIMTAYGVSRATAYRRIRSGKWKQRVPLTETKPWIAAGYRCRRTWERHGKCRRSEISRAVKPAVLGKPTARSKASASTCRSVETKPVIGLYLLSVRDRCGASGMCAAQPAQRSRPQSHAAPPSIPSDTAPCIEAVGLGDEARRDTDRRANTALAETGQASLKSKSGETFEDCVLRVERGTVTRRTALRRRQLAGNAEAVAARAGCEAASAHDG